MSMMDQLDWDRAKLHLEEVKEAYASLVETPNVNPWFGLGVIVAAESRFKRGERTRELYEEIMALK